MLLREIVYIMLTVRELIARLTAEDPNRLKAIQWHLISQITEELDGQDMVKKNL